MGYDPEKARAIFVEAVGRGPADRAELLAARCGGDDELRRHVEALLRAEDDAGSFLDRPAAVAGREVDRTGTHRPAGGNDPIDAGTVIGPYKLVEPIGEGGMGAVYLARQQEPVKRLVALKVIKAGMDSKQVLARFEAERQALALMDHPNIARVLDAGATHDGRPYFVMELVKGVPITKFCDERRLTPRERLELLLPVCHAIQHAHQKGVIHRDVKPSNVLVALYDGRPVPKVIDFGVAKAAGQPLTEKTLVTGLGTVVGTPEYMSPEQAELNQLDVDTRSDIYSLGVLLYELLTGTTPLTRKRVKEAGFLEVLRVIREEEPPRPSTRLSTADELPSIAANRGTEPARLAREFRGELDWIAMKALEKDRARRYETANALARDIQRYLADEIVEARPPSVRYRARKFVRRHKGRVAVGAIVLLGLGGGLIGTGYGVTEARNQRLASSLRTQAERDRDEAKAARGEAEAARDGEKAARAELFREKEKLAVIEYGRTMQVAYQAWHDNDIQTARTLLNGTRKDLRGWEWHHIHRLCHAELLTLQGQRGGVFSAAISPDGSQVMTAATEDRTVLLWDARTGAKLLALKHTQSVRSATFSPDGTRVVTTCDIGIVRLWDARTGVEVHALKGHTSHVLSAAFSPGGERVVTASYDKTARVWDARSGAELVALKGHTHYVASAAFSPDGTRVVTAGIDGTARVWDARTGVELLALKGHTGPVGSAAFGPDGTRIVTASSDATARLWDARTGVGVHALKGHTSVVLSAAFSPDGERVLTASYDTARVWDAQNGVELLALKGHTDAVRSAAFSPDSRRIVTGSFDSTAKVWDTRTGAELLALKGHTSPVGSAAFSPDGRRVVTAGADGTAKVWDAWTGPEPSVLKGQEGFELSAAFDPDGMRIVTSGAEARVWDARTGAELLALKGHTSAVISASFSPDGTRVLTASYDKTARIWDARSGAELLALKGHTDVVRSAAFSKDGRRVVTTSADGTAKVWDARTGAGLLALKWHTTVDYAAAFSPDGTRIVAPSGSAAQVWDAGTGAELVTLKGHAHLVFSAAFSPDGMQIITGSLDSTARVWDAQTGAELLTLKGHTQAVKAVAFSPDGTRVVTAGFDKTARVWDARTGAELLALKRHKEWIVSAAFSPDGTRVLTAGRDETARVWDARPFRDTRPPEPEFAPPPREVKTEPRCRVDEND